MLLLLVHVYHFSHIFSAFFCVLTLDTILNFIIYHIPLFIHFKTTTIVADTSFFCVAFV